MEHRAQPEKAEVKKCRSKGTDDERYRRRCAEQARADDDYRDERYHRA